MPRTYGYCDDRSIVGTPFFVMEFADGRQFFDPALPELPAEQRTALWDDINAVLARLHSVDYAAVGLGDYGKPGNYFERQVARWTRQYRAAETEPIAAMDRLIEWLPQHVLASDESAIVHGDFRMDNFIVHRTEPRVIAILDWELSTLGHPLADLAYQAMAWRLTLAQFRGMAGNDFHALGLPDRGGVRRVVLPSHRTRCHRSDGVGVLRGLLDVQAGRDPAGHHQARGAGQLGGCARGGSGRAVAHDRRGGVAAGGAQRRLTVPGAFALAAAASSRLLEPRKYRAG